MFVLFSSLNLLLQINKLYPKGKPDLYIYFINMKSDKINPPKSENT